MHFSELMTFRRNFTANKSIIYYKTEKACAILVITLFYVTFLYDTNLFLIKERIELKSNIFF